MDQQPFATPPPAHKSNKEDNRYVALSRQVSELLSRLRLLEERYANVRREHQITGQNMIENHQTLSKQLRKLNENIITIKREFSDLRDQVNLMQGELSDTAHAHELRILQRYVDLWNPMTFITRAEAEKLVEEARKVYKG